MTPWPAAHQTSLSLTHLEFAQTHIHWVSDVIQPSHPLLPPSPLAFNLSQHEGLLQWVGSSQQVAKESIRTSISASVLPMNIQGWFPWGWTLGLILFSLLFAIALCVCSFPPTLPLPVCSNTRLCYHPAAVWALMVVLFLTLQGLPWRLSDKEPTCQCRRHRFHPWVKKSPWRRKRQPTPVFLLGKIPWTEEPGRLQSMGLQSWTQLSN